MVALEQVDHLSYEPALFTNSTISRMAQPRSAA
jgi:hypothetical protein